MQQQMRSYVVIEPSNDVQKRQVKIVESPYLPLTRKESFVCGPDSEYDVFSVLCLNARVFYNDYLFFAGPDFFNCDMFDIAPYHLSTKKGILRVLWTKDENPDLVGDTFKLKNIEQVWMGKGYIALYDTLRRPVNAFLRMVVKIQGTIQWSLPISSALCERRLVLHIQKPDEKAVEGYLMKFEDELQICHCCGPCSKVKTCNRCKTVRYCSPECQKEDWKSHKKTCTQQI